jgi:death-on-curing protein
VSALYFLSKADILLIHEREIQKRDGEPSIRLPDDIEACVGAPQATFGGEYLNNLFEMAATYISCITIRHPFTDGNKRTALSAALVFLDKNGYRVRETQEDELADLIIDFLTTNLSKEDVAVHLKEHAVKI